jgi:hypothetical protein
MRFLSFEFVMLDFVMNAKNNHHNIILAVTVSSLEDGCSEFM